MRPSFNILSAVTFLFLSALSAYADRADCRREPSADCLADIGFEMAMSSDSLPSLTQAPELLAQMGRIDQAIDLQIRSQTLNGVSEEDARQFANSILNHFRIANDHLAGVQTAKNLDAQRALNRMIGSHVSGTQLGTFVTQDERKIDAIKLYARGFNGIRSEMLPIAEALIHIGAFEDARDVLDRMPVDDSPLQILSQDLIRLVGTDRATAILDGMQDVRLFQYVRVAQLADDPAAARLLLRRLKLKINTLETDRVSTMSWFIGVALDLDEMAMALAMISNLRREVYKRTPETHDLLRLAGSLSELDATREEAVEILKVIEQRLLSQKEEQSVSNVQGSVANLYRRLGEYNLAFRHFRETKPNPLRWILFLSSKNLPHDQRVKFLDLVADELGPDAINEVKAGLIDYLSRTDRRPEERRWARDNVQKLLSQSAPEKALARAYFFDRLVLAAYQLGDEQLLNQALKSSSDTALDGNEFRPIIQAAYQYDRAELWRTDLIKQRRE